MKKTLKEIVKEVEKRQRCNCDLDNWQPQLDTGHSTVCRIDNMARELYKQQLFLSKKELTVEQVDSIMKSNKIVFAEEREFIFYYRINMLGVGRYIVQRIDHEIFSSSTMKPAIDFWNNLK